VVKLADLLSLKFYSIPLILFMPPSCFLFGADRTSRAWRPSTKARRFGTELYEYYMYKASEAGTLEAKYSHIAKPDAPVNVQ
jgi:hypothetical protein